MALFETITVKNKEYKLALGIKEIISLEKKIGTNPINELMNMREDNLPSFEFLIDVFQASLQKYNKGMTLEKTEALVESMFEEDYDITSFMELVFKVLETSCFFKMNQK